MEGSKTFFKHGGKLLLQEKSGCISITQCGSLKNSIEQIKGKILEFITPEEFHLVEKIHGNLYKKSFELTKKRHIQKFNELISKNKVTQSATNITAKKKCVIDMSSQQLTHIETQRTSISALLLKHFLI